MPPAALVLASITSLQVGAAVAKGLFAEIGALGVVTLRISLAAVVLLALWRPRIPDRGEIATLVTFGLVLGAMNLAFFEALARIPLGIAVTLELLGPLAIAVALSRALLDALWTAIAITGVLLLTSGGGNVSASGIALALLAAVLRGSYILLSRRVGRARSDGGGLALALAFGSLVLVPLGVARVGSAFADVCVLATGAAVAVLSSALPYTLDLAALRRLPAQSFGVLVSLSPAIAALVGVVALGEALLLRQWIAVALVVVASAGVTLSGTQR